MRVPLDLVPTFGRTHINRSLKTTSLPEARRIMMRVGSDLERSFDEARAGAAIHGATVAHIAQHSAPVLQTGSSLSIREAYNTYLADPARRASPKSNLAYSTVADVVVGLLGPDVHLNQLTRKMCRELMGDLIKLPRNAKKRWPALDSKQAIARGTKLNLPTISIANANGYLNKFCAMLNWCVKEELLAKNPALGLRLADPVRAKDKRKPFSADQLQIIFNAPIFTGCIDDEYGYAKPGPNRPRRARFWVPLIGLLSGARLNEICQLDVQDVAEVEGILCFKITKDDASPSADKRLKTTGSERVIPVHPTLLELGFKDYLLDRARSKDHKLFPELPLRHGLYSHEFSRWFGRFLASCGAESERTCFHSFRHSFADALRRAKVDRQITLALGGWSNGNNESVADRYGNGFPIARLAEAVSLVEFEGLDLRHLKKRQSCVTQAR